MKASRTAHMCHGQNSTGSPRKGHQGGFESLSLVYSCYIIGICAFIQLQLEMSLMVVGLTSSTVAASPHPLPTEMLLNGRCWRAGITALVLLPTFPSVSAGFERKTLCDVLLGGSWFGFAFLEGLTCFFLSFQYILSSGTHFKFVWVLQTPILFHELFGFLVNAAAWIWPNAARSTEVWCPM